MVLPAHALWVMALMDAPYNLLKDEVYNQFTKGVVEKFPAKYRDTPEIYPVIITQGTHNAC